MLASKMTAPLYISSLPSHQTSSLPDAFTFAVFGSKTYAYRNELKSLGGRFSKTIGTLGAGWLFAEKKRSDVEHFISRTETVEKEDAVETISQGTIMTDKEYEEAVMIEDLIQKTLITTIISKKQDDDITTYKLVDDSVVDVKLGDVCAAEWMDGRVAIMKKGLVRNEKVKLLPFLGSISKKDDLAKIMEYFICFLTLTMSAAPVYYTDGNYSYAFCDEKTFDATIDLFDLEL